MSTKSPSLPSFPRFHLIIAGGIIAAASALVASPVSVQAKVSSLELPSGKAHSEQVSSPLDKAESKGVAVPLLLRDDNNLRFPVPSVEGVSFSDVVESYAKTANGHLLLRSQSGISDEGPVWEEILVTQGDTLSTIFSRLGLPGRTLHEIINSDPQASAFTRLKVGQKLYFQIDESADGKSLVAMEIRPNALEALRVEGHSDGFDFIKDVTEPDLRHKVVSGTIQNSLAVDARNAGMGQSVIRQLSEIFGYDIDFSRQIRSGDKFEVLFEEKHVEGETVGYGHILAARFENRGRTYTAVRYTRPDGSSSYYRADGSSMKRAFIRTPVSQARISSVFNPNRRHPILNRIRAHNGVDYAAPTGTPIKATGDGQIVHLGNKGGYGRTIVIKHGRTYQTLYAHMNRYASGLKVGSTVKQGQVIGYVGSSGMATGPHLHYEFLVNGRHVDPLKISLPTADPIPNSEKSRFMRVSNQLMAALEGDGTSEIQLAMNMN